MTGRLKTGPARSRMTAYRRDYYHMAEQPKKPAYTTPFVTAGEEYTVKPVL